ncbi:MAG: toxin-antitoxin system HicB family antitoxin [Candidatus Cloacimonadota bacterium]|nr:MAG: toxin-antitoxin system HicB family antitoxin [Candidatus Cloacimonadota bacterium]
MKATYTLRLPEELRRKIKEESERSDMSINQYILYTLTKEISYREAERALKNRIKRAPSREEALMLLDTIVPDVPPLAEDNILSVNG